MWTLQAPSQAGRMAGQEILCDDQTQVYPGAIVPIPHFSPFDGLPYWWGLVQYKSVWLSVMGPLTIFVGVNIGSI